MAVWPESDPQIAPSFIITPRWKTDIVELGGGNEQRRAAWLFPKFDVVVNYKALTSEHSETLWQFYMARRGAYEAFYIYDLAHITKPSPILFSQATPLYCGTADGVTLIYDVPGRYTTDQTIYVDGVADGSASVLSGGGDGGSDRISWSSALSEGSIISATFTGSLRMKVRFERDELSRDMFEYRLFTYGSISLKGV